MSASQAVRVEDHVEYGSLRFDRLQGTLSESLGSRPRRSTFEERSEYAALAGKGCWADYNFDGWPKIAGQNIEPTTRRGLCFADAKSDTRFLGVVGRLDA